MDPTGRYAPPTARVAQLAGGPLYTPWQAFAASFLGGPLAAIYVLRENFLCLEKDGEAQQTLLYGGAFMLVLLSVLPFLPESLSGASTGLTVAYSLGARQVVLSRQMSKEAIEQSPHHRFRSNWRVVGISVLSVAVFLLLFTGWTLALSALGLVEL